MKLRPQLGLTVVTVVVPMMVALLVLQAIGQHRAAERILSGIFLVRMPLERGRCERNPESWGDPPFANDHHPDRPMPPPSRYSRAPPDPPVAFAFDENFVTRNPAAPRISPTLRQALDGAPVAVESWAWRSRRVEVLLRTPWGTGPCAYVLARGSIGEWGALLPETPVWALPMVVLFAAVLIAVGPIVRRVRLLTVAVRRSASSFYESTIPIAGNDEIGELARAFESAGRQIRMQLRENDRREQTLRDFLANTTHDVMTPLTVLLGHLTTLREGSTADSSINRAVVSSAMDEAHYIASLVHNLGAAARLEAADAGVQFVRVDLGALVARVIGRHTPIARERHIALDSAIPAEDVFATADPTLLEQAVSNVTYNAVRYNRPGGMVAIILETEPPGRFALRIIDDGPGIAAADLAKLGARGARGSEARTRAPEGRGLGLHIARCAVEHHGFQLTFSTSEYGGLEVKIEGPRV